MDEKGDFEPKILGFLCNWCSYAGADLAGVSRYQYPPNVQCIRVMCSSRVDPMWILKALTDGADGVLIAGCHPGDCHYVEGNYRTRRRIAALKKILENYGLSDRVFLEWVSASEGKKFAEVITKVTNAIKELGPNPYKKRWEI
ncbi:MAG: hydrogenase iron-sulfur subunit [Euryarchaeota archaeon]|nr:hydrogenase iron-sulfur subunit [Euryarchaeota archaeon]